MIRNVLTSHRKVNEVRGIRALANLQQKPSDALFGGLSQQEYLILEVLGFLARDSHELLRYIATATGQLCDRVTIRD